MRLCGLSWDVGSNAMPTLSPLTASQAQVTFLWRHAMTTPVTNIFVYGTLRRGGSNHFRMEMARFVAAGMVSGRLYQIDWYPGLVLDAAACVITGEIYQVSPEVLKELDLFEGAEYRRLQTQVRLPDGETLSAWIWEWLGGIDESRRITRGDWLSPPQSAEP
jgi:gamma-glutamylcyclotransferase (GGCT)/AIG2-like uncharacterized protein YtfP